MAAVSKIESVATVGLAEYSLLMYSPLVLPFTQALALILPSCFQLKIINFPLHAYVLAVSNLSHLQV
jgi:hypothetical protein